MNIEDKIAKAVHATRCAIERARPLDVTQVATPAQQVYQVWNPDTLYVGEHEFLEIMESYRGVYPIKHFMGMRVIRVRLESYLQVACVGGDV